MIIGILFNDDYICLLKLLFTYYLETSLTTREKALSQNYPFLLSDVNAGSTDFLLNNPTS